ncbi:MAG: hypothetical protein IPH43_14380 [Xanthomonadales bacterium]|nr:hypothetical protein [Xanthomonadales bacterium]
MIRRRLRGSAPLDQGGRIAGDIRMTPGEGEKQVLTGNLALELNSLAFIELLSSEVTNPGGRLSASSTQSPERCPRRVSTVP